jgi:hypothetical protein
VKAEPVAPAPPRTDAPPPPKAKKLLIGGGIALILLLAAYGGGRLQGASAAREADDRAKAAAEKSEQAAKALAAERAQIERLEARRRLHLSLIALDERNFGIAQKHLAASAKLLERSTPKDGELAKIAAELSAERLVATEDLAAPRGKVLGWVRRIDQAMPPPAP